MEKKYWEGKGYSFFENRTCEYFPCHAWKEGREFNCLFCYCPLYVLGTACGGNFKITNEGIKDCSECLIPHKRENYEYIVNQYEKIAELVKKQINEKDEK